MGPKIQWVESYVTDDRVYCVYIASDPEILREHSRRGGFPLNKITEVKSMMDPTVGGA
jgi:hypothetical protein